MRARPARASRTVVHFLSDRFSFGHGPRDGTDTTRVSANHSRDDPRKRVYIRDVRKSERGTSMGLVVGLAALAIAVAALVIALTRNPHTSAAAQPSA